jgi:hypothetical protein
MSHDGNAHPPPPGREHLGVLFGVGKPVRHRVGTAVGAAATGLVAGGLLTAALIPDSATQFSAHALSLAEQPAPGPDPGPVDPFGPGPGPNDPPAPPPPMDGPPGPRTPGGPQAPVQTPFISPGALIR